MDIEFQNKALQTICESEKKAIKKLGKRCSTLLFQRLTQLSASDCLADLLPPMPGRYHPLLQNRSGQWACSLEGAKRLIFRPTDEACTEAKSIKAVTLLEIIDYH